MNYRTLTEALQIIAGTSLEWRYGGNKVRLGPWLGDTLLHEVDAGKPISEDGGDLWDFLEDKETTSARMHEIVEARELVSVILDVLDDRERMVIERRFGLTSKGEQTLQDIAEETGLSRERIRQIQDTAKSKMKVTATLVGAV